MTVMALATTAEQGEQAEATDQGDGGLGDHRGE